MAEINHDAAEEGDRQLLSTLPKKERMWKPFFLYRGCWLTPRAVTSITLLQSQFAPRPDDVVLATFPKCSTTWLKALAFAFAVANHSRHPVVSAPAPTRCSPTRRTSCRPSSCPTATSTRSPASTSSLPQGSSPPTCRRRCCPRASPPSAAASCTCAGSPRTCSSPAGTT
uniref:Sulfotransferase n=1 Tax=Aegilops tauschii subsp. strangulata TaxID=200361 RepID=A0A453RK59_AEGTS